MTAVESFLSAMQVESQSNRDEGSGIREILRLKKHASGDNGSDYILRQMQRIAAQLGIDIDLILSGKVTADNWQQFVTESRVFQPHAEADQRERHDYMAFVKQHANGDYEAGARLWAQHKKRPADDVFGDSARLASVKQALRKIDPNDLAEEDLHDLWIIAQHADRDTKFQVAVLKLLGSKLGEKSEDYRYLSDRISCNTKGTQRYGTQDHCEKCV